MHLSNMHLAKMIPVTDELTHDFIDLEDKTVGPNGAFEAYRVEDEDGEEESPAWY